MQTGPVKVVVNYEKEKAVRKRNGLLVGVHHWVSIHIIQQAMNIKRAPYIYGVSDDQK